jgi:lipopolysaccharide/colanic/teichoic acid biosynthesis glycosyltransferase
VYQKYIKRLLDIILACVILALTLPITLTIAILIKIESAGPAIFTQERTGLHGRIFRLRKFRSMAHDNNVRDVSKQDQLTKVGKTLRSLSLDEVPQLINVLRGEMSFIGPRPWIPEYFQHMNDKQRQRNGVRPGITGLAQAYGRNSLTINQKISYDLEYVKDISFREDVKIIFITLRTMFDKSTHEIGKSGIHNELDVLKKQSTIKSADRDTNKSNHRSISNRLYS